MARGEFTLIDSKGATLTRTFGIYTNGDIVGTYLEEEPERVKFLTEVVESPQPGPDKTSINGQTEVYGTSSV